MSQEYAKTKDQELGDILTGEHLYTVEILPKEYANRGIDYDDIFRVVFIGLIYGVERYGPPKGYEFSNSATPTIIGEIKKYSRDKGWTIRVSRRIQELSKKINNAKVILVQEYQRTPTIKDIVDYLNVSQEDVLESIEASKAYSPTSLDLKFEGAGDDKEVNLSDLIGEEEPYFNQIEVNDSPEKAVEKLNDVEKTILTDRYYNKKTQVSIAERLDISQMIISRIEKKILEKIRKEAYRVANM